MTPHIEAKKGEIAKTVIMAGDPKRVKFIAENYLDNAKLVNKVRLALCYTGTYKGKNVSIMTSGMGMPSMGIYSYELFKFYEVEEIIRLGSCLSLDERIGLNDIILATSAYTSSNFAYNQGGVDIKLINSSSDINDKIKKSASMLNYNIYDGKVVTSDIFYKSCDNLDEQNQNAIGLEMETFALLYNAKILSKKATSLLTVSDSIYIKEQLTSEEREKSFTKAIKLVLESIIL